MVLSPDLAKNKEKLLMPADESMCRAKAGGEGGVILYQP